MLHLFPFLCEFFVDALVFVNRTVVGIKCKDGIVLVRLVFQFSSLVDGTALLCLIAICSLIGPVGCGEAGNFKDDAGGI